MTTTAISRRSDSARRQPLYADLVFWTITGGVVAALSRQLADWWVAPRAILLDVGLAFVVFGPILVWAVSRLRPTRGLMAGFVATNFVLAPVAFASAACSWLPLRAAGNWALADAGAIMLALGVWQLTALRRR